MRGATVLGATVLGTLLAVATVPAQGQVASAVTETRSAAQGLEPEVRRVAARSGAAWIGYRVRMVAGPRRLCCSDGGIGANACCGACRLEGGSGVTLTLGDLGTSAGSTQRITIEPPADMLVFARVDAGQIVRLRTFTPDCDIDASGAPVVWLNEVKPAESVAWLATLVSVAPEADTGRDSVTRVARPAMAAIALHDTPAGVPLLIQFARANRNTDVRRQAMFWLGQSRDPRATAFFEEILRSR